MILESTKKIHASNVITILLKKTKKIGLLKVKGKKNPTLVTPYLSLWSLLVKRPIKWFVTMKSII